MGSLRQGAQALVAVDLIPQPLGIIEIPQGETQVVAHIAVPFGVVPVTNVVHQRLDGPKLGLGQDLQRRLGLDGFVEVSRAAGEVDGVTERLDGVGANRIPSRLIVILLQFIEAVQQPNDLCAAVGKPLGQRGQVVEVQPTQPQRLVDAGQQVGLATVAGEGDQDGHAERLAGRLRQGLRGRDPGDALQGRALAAARLAQDDRAAGAGQGCQQVLGRRRFAARLGHEARHAHGQGAQRDEALGAQVGAAGLLRQGRVWLVRLVGPAGVGLLDGQQVGAHVVGRG